MVWACAGEGQRIFMEGEDTELVGVREEDAEDRVCWRQMVGSSDP